MPVRVFLAVEGRNDGGALGQSIRARPNDPANEGALQPLIRRTASSSSLVLIGQKITMVSLKGLTEPEQAIGRRARQASVLAEFNGCEVLVFHQDVDGPAGGRPDDRVHAWNAVSEAVRAGAEVAERLGEGLAADACVAAAPLRTIESWLLGDPPALAQIARQGSEDVSIIAQDPEGLWGPRDVTDSTHPKDVFHRGVGGPSRKVRTADYRDVAEIVAIYELRRTCSLSFPPFADAVGRLVA